MPVASKTAPIIAAVRKGSAMRRLRMGASPAVMALAVTLAAGGGTPALAGTYTAATEAELIQALNAAAIDGDASATITLTGDIAITDPATLPTVSKLLTIDTAGFALTGAGPAGAGITDPGLNGLTFLGGQATIIGQVRGGAAANVNSRGVGGAAIFQGGGTLTNQGGLTGGTGGNTRTGGSAQRIGGTGGAGVSGANLLFVNGASGTIIGGGGGNHDTAGYSGTSHTSYAGTGGAGVSLTGGSLDNRGAIFGGVGGQRVGSGGSDNSYGGVGGVGANLIGGVHSNSGTITGGRGNTGRNAGGSSGHGGSGAGLSLTGGGFLLNTGTIRGENALVGGGSNGAGPGGGAGAVLVDSRIENYGAIIGGNTGYTNGSAVGVGAGVSATRSHIINDGSIASGQRSNGAYDAAIKLLGGNILELRSNSSLTGYVTALATDTLALGGTVNADFDVPTIGAGGQYRGFGRFEKTGSSVWTLTGSTTEVTPWTLTGGVLSVSDDALLGAASGTLTFNGGILRVGSAFTSTARSINWGANGGGFDVGAGNSFTVHQDLASGGVLTKLGAGKLILSGTNGYTGGTTIAAGELQMGDGGTTGSIVGDVLNNGSLVFNRSNAWTFGGAISGGGVLSHTGGGVTTLTGVNSYIGATTLRSGELRLANGGRIIGSTGLKIADTTGEVAAMTISGIGSQLKIGPASTVDTGYRAKGVLTVEKGASAEMHQVTLGFGPSGHGTLNIDGAGSSVVFTNAGSVWSLGGAGTGVLNVIGGGRLQQANGVRFGGIGGTGRATVSGAGSIWTLGGALDMRSGSLSVLAGGVVDGASASLGSNNGAMDALVSGPGSRLTSQTTFALANASTATASLTITDGGTVKPGSGILAMGAGRATLNIGGAEGQAATGAGFLDAAQVTMAAATGRINFNHTDAAYTFAPVISGLGGINHLGSGVTILSADNSYAGATSVSGGTLLINGNQSAATGPTSVGSGGTLGGAGTIGRSVVVADGGSLTPGGGTGQVGTLTINGGLTLDAGSTSNFQFGAAGVAGGPMNDLVDVKGDLTLDGTLNVAVTPGGAFDVGVYRVFNYGGILTDGGLALGAMPGDNRVFVQTAVNGQVNLVNRGTNPLNFWDGATGPKFDGVINGGSGLWQDGSGNNNWTEDTGGVNAVYDDAAFAIFMGTAGTITVDDSLGTVRASGMQFATNGYRVEGDGLTLVGPQSTIQVGDGTASGAAITATIDADLSGTTQLVKTDLGTLILSGANSFTGGVALNGGVVQVSADANLGAPTGDLIFDRGALHITADLATGRDLRLDGQGTVRIDAGRVLGLAGDISGDGQWVIDGGGWVALQGDARHTGGTYIKFGTLLVGGNNGGGGATGSLAGDVEIDAAADLIFNRSNLLTFGGLISGDGRVAQIGGGVTALTAANSYKGGTQVLGGTLLINGDQSAATGDTLVDGLGSSTLGGTGVIGGRVSVMNGRINPGDLSGNPATLTINGDLALTAASVLDLTLGQANVEAGPLNDLIKVGGNLVLEGTLNVKTTPGGTFDPGVYRIISYGGALTGSGLNVGTIPSPNFYVQTSVAQQVNLINTAGMAFRFWDGAAGGRNDGVISGGDGLWQNPTGNDNWTEQSGRPNASFADSAFAVFMGSAGVVEVDAGLGGVNVAGMQFLTDGYRVEGDALNLTGTQAVIRVGDGTTDGAATQAVIASQLTGDAELVKGDLGTLILTGSNTYVGGTTIDNGVLQLGDGGTSGAILGDVVNDGALAFNRSDNVVFSGMISGDGGLIQKGTGATVLTAENSFTGGATILSGVLQLGDGGATGGFQGDVANNGVLAFNRSNSLVFDGRVSGAGAVRQNGSGTTTLTGENTYSGGTAINAGVLQLGDGGTTGSIQGDVLNNAALALDRSNTLELAGVISGSGTVRQMGAGVTILTGDNRYSGVTDIRRGTLLVNGDQSLAKGLTSVNSGAVLGGSGVIGGDVIVGDGASLAPGGAVGKAGTLTTDGDLSLGAGSSSDFQFGAANVAGGSLNDLVNVGGDLILDGTLNVSVTAGGSFDAGIYRVFNYGGALIDQGLELGGLPAGAEVIVQTSVANQVNLVNSGDLSLNFWDGAAGPKFDGQVSGGDGVWQNGTGNNNWTEATGAINATYDDGAFAIFMGAAGTVSIDNSLGAVTVSGMQFATDGYRIQGDALTLVGPQTTARVGDGTTVGAGIIATIASQVNGDSQLVKTDLGTLVLTADNGFTGGTIIHDGVLQLGDGGTTGAIRGDVVSDGVLAFNRSDVSTFAGRISGGGALHQFGSGTTILSGDSAGFTGQTRVSRGVLAVTGTLGGGVEVLSGARLEGTGTVGDVMHRQGGVIAPGMGLGVLTLSGDYVGAGGTLEIEAVLGSDDSVADRLVIGGGATGAATVQVLNRGGLGAQTTDGIKIIDIVGGSAAEFTLAGDYLFEDEQAVIAGAYGYVLRKNAATGPADGDWYLRSSLISQPSEPIYQPGVPVYEAYSRALAALNGLPTLRQRVGDRQQADDGAWIRAEGSIERLGTERSTSGTAQQTQTWKVQMGLDRVLTSDVAGNTVIAAVTAHYGEANTNAASVYGAGGVDGRGFGLGATLTWYGAHGGYVDGQAQFSRFESDLTSGVLGDLVEGNVGYGQVFGLEGGRVFDLGGGFTATPQAQAVYSRVTFDRFLDPSEAIVAMGDNRSLDTRVGVAVDYVKAWGGAREQQGISRFYGVANLHYEWLDGITTKVSGTSLGHEGRPLWAEAGFGASHDWDEGRYVLFGEVSAATAIADFGDDSRIKGSVGFRMQF